MAARDPRWSLGLLVLAVLIARPGPVVARERGADGRYDERRSAHFILQQDVDIDRVSGWRGSRSFEREVLAQLEAAHRELDQRLALRLRRPVLVTIHDPGVFDARFSGLFRFPAGGVYAGSMQLRGDVRVTLLLERTLRHELVHAAFDARAPSYPPPGWINEGTAEWFEQRGLGKRHPSHAELAELGAAAASGALPLLDQLAAPGFGHLPPPRARLAYLTSYAAVEHLVRRRGEERFASFLQDLLRLRDPERALVRNYRIGVAGLDAALRDELR